MGDTIKISEDEMILEFLQAEIESSRFQKALFEELKTLESDHSLITTPDLTDPKQNSLRKSIFKRYRDFENEEGLFEGFPKDVEWFVEELSKETLFSNVYYIDYSYWNEITNGSRLPVDALERINNGIKVFDVPYDNFIDASSDFKHGKKFKRLILVSDGSKYVVVEGHLRMTVYAMNSDLVPDPLQVIVGYSKSIHEWSSF